jgi:hypothetical protein
VRLTHVVRLTAPRVVVAVHHQGWSSVRRGREGAERDPATAPEEVRRRVRRLEAGAPTDG